MARTWAMTKWADGDWWLMSNDRETMYRFRRYEEDGSLTEGNTGRVIRGTFWLVEKIAVDDLRAAAFEEPEWGGTADPDDLDWDYVAGLFATRAQCVSYVEEIMDRTEQETTA